MSLPVLLEHQTLLCVFSRSEYNLFMEEAWRDVIVRERAAGRRVDAFLARRFPSYSRSQIVRYIQEGKVRSLLRKLKPSTTLILGEVLRLYMPGLVPSGPPPAVPEILFEDEQLLVVQKPPGMLVHPAGDQFVWALIGLVRAVRPNDEVDLVHRIDRETSGALLLTKKKSLNSSLKKQLIKRGMHKTYLALVYGSPGWEQIDIEQPIGHLEKSEIRLRRGVVEGGQYCRTGVKVLNRGPLFSLVECTLYTGRTHQIRVHMEHVGHPLVGDKLYGHPDEVFLNYLEQGVTQELRERIRFPRHCLHSHTIAFMDISGEYRKFKAPVFADMANLMESKQLGWTEDMDVENY